MDVWDHFAAEAERFVRWVDTGMQSGAEGAAEALARITRLYAAGLELPYPEPGDIENDSFRVSQDEWQVVLARCSKLPIDYYNTCEADLAAKPEYMVGSLSDDIADIYRDVLPGLRLYRANHRNEAAWEWGFLFRAHWGTHAVDAIRVLHRNLFI